MNLYVFDKNMKLIGNIDEFDSFMWERNYYDPDKITIKIPPNFDNMELFQNGYTLVKAPDMKESIYIDHRSISKDDDGINFLTIRGLSHDGWLDRRITLFQQEEKGNSETVARALIDKNCINCEDSKRVIPFLKLGVYKGLGKEISRVSHYKNLNKEVIEVIKESELGIMSYFDESDFKIGIEFYQGKDRTALQEINTPAIFSVDFENIEGQTFVDSDSELKNTCLVAGAGEGKARKTLMLNSEVSGLDRRELFVDARDISDKRVSGENEISIPINEYNELLKQRGLEKLSDCEETLTYEGDIIQTEGLIYREDYDLGDKVTLMDRELGIMLNERITQIVETYTKEGLQIDVRVGNNIPTLIDKIKRKIGD